jgi:hypothetical protein
MRLMVAADGRAWLLRLDRKLAYDGGLGGRGPVACLAGRVHAGQVCSGMTWIRSQAVMVASSPGPGRGNLENSAASGHRPPAGVRGRQLLVRTLLLGMLIVLGDHRPAHLTRVHHALATLSQADQRRLGILARWKAGPHLLTHRQTERTSDLVADALSPVTPLRTRPPPRTSRPPRPPAAS